MLMLSVIMIKLLVTLYIGELKYVEPVNAYVVMRNLVSFGANISFSLYLSSVINIKCCTFLVSNPKHYYIFFNVNVEKKEIIYSYSYLILILLFLFISHLCMHCNVFFIPNRILWKNRVHNPSIITKNWNFTYLLDPLLFEYSDLDRKQWLLSQRCIVLPGV